MSDSGIAARLRQPVAEATLDELAGVLIDHEMLLRELAKLLAEKALAALDGAEGEKEP